MQDQYINHIMNETGAIVLLKGRGSGNAVGVYSEGTSNYVKVKNDQVNKHVSILFIFL